MISIVAAFWTMGVLNNIPYVIMLAGAKSISQGGTALVFIANIMPGFLLKLSSPYWFDKVSYKRRLISGAFLMGLSFIFVAIFGYLNSVKNGVNNNINDGNNEGVSLYVLMELLGVAFGSLQGSLGEATLLALSGRADSLLRQRIQEDSRNNSGDNNDVTIHERKRSLCITAFASGTGLAGPLGFAYIVFVTSGLGLSLTAALCISLIFPIAYIFVFIKYLLKFTDSGNINNNDENEEEVAAFINQSVTIEESITESSSSGHYTVDDDCSDLHNNSQYKERIIMESAKSVEISSESFDDNACDNESDLSSDTTSNIVKAMNMGEKFKLSLSLWPYMIPLFIVYTAEYALQSGVWTAIGFPVEDEVARNRFYTNSNWAYQIGVFVSRSSGAFCIAPMWLLWLMPILQCANLIYFYLIATFHFWYTSILFILCFYVGLLGGSVYVNGYMRINKDLPISIREFALSTASIADGLGIVVADISGLFIQSCLYKNNNIAGSVVSCPI